MSQNSLVQQSKPVLFEGVFVILIGLVIIYNITSTDINFHGKYVGYWIERCHPTNFEDACVDFREFLNIPKDSQMEIGSYYWQDLARQAFMIGVTMFLIRFGLMIILKIAHLQRIRISSILMAILYGVVGYGLFVTGLLDTFYFVIQGQPVPEKLDWLNHAGLFEYSRGWDGDISFVSQKDLYLTNFVGVLLIGTILILTMISFREANVQKGIA